MGKLRFKVVALSLGLFMVVSYLLCIIAKLVAPDIFIIHKALELLPGFVWFSWKSFVIGLMDSFLYGVYAAAVYVPLFNWIEGRFEQ